MILAWLAPMPAKAEVQVLAVRATQTQQGLRFVVELDRNVEFQAYLLPDPARVVVDLPELDWRAAQVPLPAGGLIERYRFGRFRAGQGRLVLDATQPVKFANPPFLLGGQKGQPNRLVIDLEKTDEAGFREAVKGGPPPVSSSSVAAAPIKLVPPPVPVAAPVSAQAPTPVSASKRPAPQAADKRLVVVDPGHGGVDPGTIGRAGSYEKDVTLAAGLELKRVLEASGRYRVVMTRANDVFIPLGERVTIARNAKADLFVSLHADSIATAGTRGASVYTLSNTASDKEAERLAAKENASDLIAGLSFDVKDEDVNKILIDLTRRKTDEFSVIFARDLLDEMVKGVRVLEPRAHRSAGFRVLKAPDVPSVLVEMGYLSNKDDERFLTSRDGRQKVAQALLRAIDHYFKRKLE
jgi:N-acetylmuramoyl-L-alanine amidase